MIVITNEWLAGLKEGDEVILSYSNTYTLAEVERATKTQVVVDGGRYMRSNGYKIGYHDSFSRPRILIPTPAMKEKAARMMAFDKLSKVYANRAKLTLDQMLRMIAIAEEKQP